MVARIVWTLVRIPWIAAMVAAPLFGFWLASSLAAYNNATQWLALAAGLLLFPIGPAGWEVFARWRRSRQPTRRQVLTGLDRLVLRTLVINALFVGAMMLFARATALRAVAQRGDWMFDGYDGAAADTLRGWLLALADRLESHAPASQFGTSDKAPQPTPIPSPSPTPGAGPKPAPAPDAHTWPLPDAPDPGVAAMPTDAQASIAGVGAYVREHFPDPWLRVKALHDFVVMRLTYDEAALAAYLRDGNAAAMLPQDAEAVFARKTAVCEGYARLMVALGKAADVEIAYIAGAIRDARRRVAAGDNASVKAALEGYGHAWNAAKLDGNWQLVDATWDDPTGGPPTLRSTYLFTPPSLFLLNHLPGDASWQLVPSPLSAGEFVRQPMMSPSEGRYGLALVDPARSQVSVDDGVITIVLDNPHHAEVMGRARVDGSGGEGVECATDTSPTRSAVSCKLGSGEFEIELFAAAQDVAHGSHEVRLEYVGSVLANSR